MNTCSVYGTFVLESRSAWEYVLNGLIFQFYLHFTSHEKHENHLAAKFFTFMVIKRV